MSNRSSEKPIFKQIHMICCTGARNILQLSKMLRGVSFTLKIMYFLFPWFHSSRVLSSFGPVESDEQPLKGRASKNISKFGFFSACLTPATFFMMSNEFLSGMPRRLFKILRMPNIIVLVPRWIQGSCFTRSTAPWTYTRFSEPAGALIFELRAIRKLRFNE